MAINIDISAQHLPAPSAGDQLRTLAAYADEHDYNFDTYGINSDY